MESLSFPMSTNIPPCQLLFLIWARTHPDTEVRRPGNCQKHWCKKAGTTYSTYDGAGEAAGPLNRTIHTPDRSSTDQLSVTVWSHACVIKQIIRNSHLKTYNRFILPIQPHPSFLPQARPMASRCSISAVNVKLWGMAEPKSLNKTANSKL